MENSVEPELSEKTVGKVGPEENVNQITSSSITKEANEEIDPYDYIKREEFTTEIFKIEIKNIPHTGHKQFKRRLTGTLGLKIRKLKIVENGDLAFCNFMNEQERKEAILKINGHAFKGNILHAKAALPRQDPRLKRKLEVQGDEGLLEKKRKKDEYENSLPEDERINNAVAPLWKEPYEAQLKQKTASLHEYLSTLESRMVKQNEELRKLIAQQKKENKGFMCQVDDILSSPILTNYRNKCEFSVMTSVSGKKKTSGFRLGSYSSGNLAVGSVSECVLVKDAMKHANQFVEQYLQGHSELPSYDIASKEGHWHCIMMRSNCKDQIMVNLVCVRNGMDQEAVELEKSKIQNFFDDAMMKKSGVVSLYFSLQNVKDENDVEMIHVAGEKTITEDLLGLKFQISPQSFFQVNSPAAAKLYTAVGKWCAEGKKAPPNNSLEETEGEEEPTGSKQEVSNTTVLDICCGTGTIGLALAKNFKSVIGIEMCQSAVEDAKRNAEINHIQNSKFYCGKAEHILPTLIHSLCTKDVVAVVDPPRAGLHSTVVKSIRNTSYIKRVVYVSCNQKGAIDNLTMFTSRTSKRVLGAPFRLVRVMPVDLFPQTAMYELILLLER